MSEIATTPTSTLEKAVHARIDEIRRKRAMRDGHRFAKQWSRWQREKQDAEEDESSEGQRR